MRFTLHERDSEEESSSDDSGNDMEMPTPVRRGDHIKEPSSHVQCEGWGGCAGLYSGFACIADSSAGDLRDLDLQDLRDLMRLPGVVGDMMRPGGCRGGRHDEAWRL
eukprot:350660-Chlamydomonas_euryale.AAC.9